MKKRTLQATLAAVALASGLPLAAIAAGTPSGVQAPVSAPETSQTCKGTVVDADGEPLIGATVLVDGTQNGAATDMEGNFSLNNVKPGAKISIRYVGYVPQTVTWNGKDLNIVLQDASNTLDEMVVVGYGVQKKVNLTGAVTQVKGDQLAMHPVGDAAQMLQGLVPGLTVTNANSGRPGGSASLSLRGQGNLSGTGAPYILVDGVEMDLADVNPNDIESISVLKDAGASSIYGARAAYGVILVTTKRGQDGKMRVSYQGTVGWNSPTKLPDMLDGYEFAKYWNQAAVNAGVSRMYDEEHLEALRKYCEDPSSVNPWMDLDPEKYYSLNPQFENSELGVGNTDYFDLHYKDWAFKQNHNVSASGGGKRAQYYISLGYYDENGILRYADMGYKRYNFASSIRSEITKWLSVRANAKFMHSDTDTPFGDDGISEGFYHSLARFRPTVHYLDPNGNFTELSMVPYLQSGTYTTSKRDRTVIQIGADLEPIKNWKIQGDYTYKYMGVQGEGLNMAPDIYGSDGTTTSKGVRSELGIQTDGRYTRSQGVSRYQNANVNTNYSLSINDQHNFYILAGYQTEQNQYSYWKAYTNGQYSTATPGLSLGSTNAVTSETRNSWSTRGFYGRLTYDFEGRYLFEVNMRYDGTSRFSSKHRWGFFPSFSAGWNIAQEKFMESLRPTLNNLKLRASWGKMGNQAGAALYTFAATMGTESKGNYWFANGRDGYIGAPGVIDPFVTWEKVESKNIGLDFGLFNNALSGTFELFQRDTKDMLGPGYDFPDFFGADAPQANNANMRNRGWELQVNWQGRIGRDITYSVGGSVSDATAVVTKYENPTNLITSWYDGCAVGQIWGYKSAGLIQTQAQADEYNSKYDLSYLNGGTWTPGDVMYIDLDGDGAINKGDQTLENSGDWTVIGNTTPRYEYTINGSIGWKGLNLRVMFQGVGKRDWNPGTAPYFWGWGAYAQVTLFKEHLDYWTEDNPGAYYCKPYIHTAGGITTYNNRNRQTCDRYIQNAAYLRMKNITLSYDLPKEWMNRVGLDKVQVFVTGENLLTFTKLAKMFDPEAIFTKNAYTSEGGKNYPMNKVISMGLVVNL